MPISQTAGGLPRRAMRSSQGHLEPGVSFHHFEDLHGSTGRQVTIAAYIEPQIDDMLLQRIGLVAVSLLPQHRGEIAHGREAVGMRFTELAASRRYDGFEELAGRIEVALGRNRSREIVDRSQCFEAVVAVKPAHPLDDLLLSLARSDQIALRGHRDG